MSSTHAPLLLGLATAGTGFLAPSTSLGAALATPSGGVLATQLAARATRRLDWGSGQADSGVASGQHCRDLGQDCCWAGWEKNEAFACASGYRPELTGESCFMDLDRAFECKQDASYNTRPACESHVEAHCASSFFGATAFSFVWMLWGTLATVLFVTAACTATSVSKYAHSLPLPCTEMRNTLTPISEGEPSNSSAGNSREPSFTILAEGEASNSSAGNSREPSFTITATSIHRTPGQVVAMAATAAQPVGLAVVVQPGSVTPAAEPGSHMRLAHHGVARRV